ncbi:hypothetical protein [Streptomyces himastatinicus]|uniref:hypothetical protein n=1 Tax=Streptomyces himastatinicus TaxID=998084 RepID=UPI0001B51912|nr:hypothetical protein [Streptomyces himastatinicus]
MEWITLASTVVGAGIATGSALLLDRRRWQRERRDRELETRRTLYGDYLACLGPGRRSGRASACATR